MTATLRAAFRGGYRGQPGWFLEFAYDEDLIAALKARISAADRAWDPETKRWWVSDLFAEPLAELLPAFQAFRDQPQLF